MVCTRRTDVFAAYDHGRMTWKYTNCHELRACSLHRVLWSATWVNADQCYTVLSRRQTLNVCLKKGHVMFTHSNTPNMSQSVLHTELYALIQMCCLRRKLIVEGITTRQ